MTQYPKIIFTLAALIMLAGCGHGFGQKLTRIDWGAKKSQGTITVSDPKLYRREALINERRQEVEWINDLIDDSREQTFTPEILREVEIIRAFSASLGLSFDPASGANFRRAEETSEIQQEISVLQLQLQLDQLRRDAELLREGLATQTEPANENLGQLGEPATPQQLSSPEVDTVVQQLSSTITALQTRLDASSRGPLALSNNTAANPIDLFRDRQAYRDALKTARNAASLDELHDLGASTLLRLTFQATVLPNTKKPAAPGVVQMEVQEQGDAEIRKFYLEWIEYENKKALESKNDDQIKRLELNGLTTRVFHSGVSANKTGRNVCDGLLTNRGDMTEAMRKAEASKRAADKNRNDFIELANDDPNKLKMLAEQLRSDTQAAIDAQAAADEDADLRDCTNVDVIVPSFAGTQSQESANEGLFEWYSNNFRDRYSDSKNQGFIDKNQEIRQNLITIRDAIRSGLEYKSAGYCDLNRVRSIYRDANFSTLSRSFKSNESLFGYIEKLQRTKLLGQFAESIRVQAKAAKLTIAKSERAETIRKLAADAADTLNSFAFVMFANCPNNIALTKEFSNLGPNIGIPIEFRQALKWHQDNIFVYDVNPREQVQQIGTNARASSSLSLALSLAASSPKAGAAADLAAGYAKQASGRVEARERVPAIVGYSIGEEDKFGWVLGPRATLDPKGKLTLEHALKPHDLTVDLSVPFWWSELKLNVLKAWAPSQEQIASGTLTKKEGEVASQTFSIPLTRTEANFDAFSKVLARPSYARNLRNFAPSKKRSQRVSACRSSVIHIKGNEAWRISGLLIGGYQVPYENVQVAPDMAGALITVPALHDKIVSMPLGNEIDALVLTPYNNAVVPLYFEGFPAVQNQCGRPADPKALTVTGNSHPIIHLTFDANGQAQPVKITLRGTNLGNAKMAEFGGVNIGTPSPGAKGKTMDITIPSSAFAGRSSGTLDLILIGDENKRYAPIPIQIKR